MRIRVIVTIVLVAAAAFGTWFTRLGIGNGTSDKELSSEPIATPPPENASFVADPATGPLDVYIREHDYSVRGRVVTLDEIVELARKVERDDGPRVRIVLENTARVSAESQLEARLRSEKITFGKTKAGEAERP